MTYLSTGAAVESGNVRVAAAMEQRPSVSFWFLDAVLTRQATRTWWMGMSVLLAVGLLLHGLAWAAFPTIATADTNLYVVPMHAIERGELPDLRAVNIGYSLFMLACKQLPMALNRSLPLVQHLLELTAVVALAVWMRKRWGVLASLMLAALLLVSSYRAIWSHYGHRNALLCSIVPIAALVGLQWMVRRGWTTVGLAILACGTILITREETILPVLAAPLLVAVVHRKYRKAGICWAAMILVLVTGGVAMRTGINQAVSGQRIYSVHGKEAIVWRVMHQDALVAPPRPERLNKYFAAAAANGSRLTSAHYTWEDLWRAGRDQFGLTKQQSIDELFGLAIECTRNRPWTYLSIVVTDTWRLWADPEPSLEWAAYRQSDPEKFHADSARLEWTHDARREFPTRYAPSTAQRWFRTLLFLRPGESFAMVPLIVLFVLAASALVAGVGCRRRSVDRWWALGLAYSVVVMTVFYAAIADVPSRFRMSFEWAFFVVAVLGVILPLRACRSWMNQRHDLVASRNSRDSMMWRQA